MSFPRQCRAFSLVELIMAMAILGILIALLLPNIAQYIERSRQITSVNQLIRMLNQARSIAVTQGITVGVCAGDGTTCAANSRLWQDQIMIFSDTDQNGVLDSSEILHLGYIASRHAWSWNRSRPINFKADGTLNGSNGTYCLYQDSSLAIHTGNVLKVIVSISGRARMDTSDRASDASAVSSCQLPTASN